MQTFQVDATFYLPLRGRWRRSAYSSDRVGPSKEMFPEFRGTICAAWASSATESNPGGNVMARVLAVFRLMIISNLTACVTVRCRLCTPETFSSVDGSQAIAIRRNRGHMRSARRPRGNRAGSKWEELQ